MSDQLSELGEAGAIRRFAGGTDRDAGRGHGVVVGIGDDAAVVDAPAGLTLLTTDMLVEGRHFLAGSVSPEDLGYKALAVNVSDIAAMGGVPAHALVSLSLPRDTPTAFLDGLRSGFQEAAREHGAVLVGGDTTAGDAVVINVALTGTVPSGRRYVTRGGARVGDVVCVSNTLGSSDGGLRLLRAGRSAGLGEAGRLQEAGPDEKVLLRAHMRPRARVAEGLAAAAVASAMIDISDGLIVDLGHVCEASGVGAEIDAEAVPVAAELMRVAADLGFDPLDCALAGGEDYELLITVDEDRLAKLEGEIRAAGSELAVVGRIVAGSGVTARGAAPARGGWDHFAAGDEP